MTKHPVLFVLLAVVFLVGFFGARQLLLDLGLYNGEVSEVACPADALLCPDGSAVGRTGPNCTFAPCPFATEVLEVEPGPSPTPAPPQIDTTPVPSSGTLCNPDNRPSACTREYQPVCGLVEVQCITTPCNPVPETFSNGCSACSQSNVISYTSGSCEAL